MKIEIDSAYIFLVASFKKIAEITSTVDLLAIEITVILVVEVTHLLFFLFQDECHNFIKVLLKKNDDTLFVCGTNAFSPSCRTYKVCIAFL